MKYKKRNFFWYNFIFLFLNFVDFHLWKSCNERSVEILTSQMTFKMRRKRKKISWPNFALFKRPPSTLFFHFFHFKNVHAQSNDPKSRKRNPTSWFSPRFRAADAPRVHLRYNLPIEKTALKFYIQLQLPRKFRACVHGRGPAGCVFFRCSGARSLKLVWISSLRGKRRERSEFGGGFNCFMLSSCLELGVVLSWLGAQCTFLNACCAMSSSGNLILVIRWYSFYHWRTSSFFLERGNSFEYWSYSEGISAALSEG